MQANLVNSNTAPENYVNNNQEETQDADQQMLLELEYVCSIPVAEWTEDNWEFYISNISYASNTYNFIHDSK